MAAAAFARIDADNNGLLDIAELGAALGILGLEGAQQPTPLNLQTQGLTQSCCAQGSRTRSCRR